MPWINKIPALIQSWYNGSEAGCALANIISGEVTPSGKLPFSIPKKLEDNGANFYGELSFPGDSINVYYKEDIFVGYRWYDTKRIIPLFHLALDYLIQNLNMEEWKPIKENIAKPILLNYRLNSLILEKRWS